MPFEFTVSVGTLYVPGTNDCVTNSKSIVPLCVIGFVPVRTKSELERVILETVPVATGAKRVNPPDATSMDPVTLPPFCASVGCNNDTLIVPELVIGLPVEEMPFVPDTIRFVSVPGFAVYGIYGTGVIKDFMLALVVGIVAGTYSSIYVAAPLTEWIDKRMSKRADMKKRLNAPAQAT